MEKLSFRSVVENAGGDLSKPVRAVGIDLGTTISTAAEAVFDPGDEKPQVRCLAVPQPRPDDTEHTDIFVPSVVALDQGKPVVGEPAKLMRAKCQQLGLDMRRNIFYNCKNDMGIRKTYNLAPAGFRSAWEIGSQVLGFIKNAVLSPDAQGPGRMVVTVPASFQAAQRNDTRKAASAAGISIGTGDLLDEPVAAFMDYLFTYGMPWSFSFFNSTRNLLVFDFGGGTCDVAIFSVSKTGQDGFLSVSPLSISRYHRLGGGDIDAAIVHEVLIPELCRQNGLNAADLGYEEKKRFLEPALLDIAEQLKIQICSPGRPRNEKAVLNGAYECAVADRTIMILNPSLAHEEFEKVLAPFLDREMLVAKEGDYRLTCSVFAPIMDALDRCCLDPGRVDLVLMAGGSSLIPQVKEALACFFRKSTMLLYPDRESIKTTVARGAAYHALALAITGKAIIRSVVQEPISIVTQDGPLEIVPRNASLPYPASGEFRMADNLCVPEESVLEQVKIRVELVSGECESQVFSGLWVINQGIVNKGDPILLEYRYDENQVLWLRMRVNDGCDHNVFEAEVENPLTCIVNPNRAEICILELEENLRTGVIKRPAYKEEFAKLADLYIETGKREKAVYAFKKALACAQGPDNYLLNRLGMLCNSMGNLKQAERFYSEAGNMAQDGTALFNLALQQKNSGEFPQALGTINKAISQGRSIGGPYKVLKAMILEKQGYAVESKKALEESLKGFDPVSMQDEWSLGWYKSCMAILGRKDEVEAAEEEIKNRAREKEEAKKRRPKQTGMYPALVR